MNHPHPLGILSSQSEIEAVDPKFLLEGVLRARQDTLATLEEIRRQLRVGMTEDEARKLALKISSEKGVTRHWHKPYIRFGVGTALTFHDLLQPNYRLKDGDPYYIDLGPVWRDPELNLEYEGDCGDTFIFGVNPEAEKCALAARKIFHEARSLWRELRLNGQQLYEFLKQRSAEMGFVLVENVDGHRLSDFPHQKYSKARLAQVPFIPSEGLWVLEILIRDPQSRFGAFFEDLL